MSGSTGATVMPGESRLRALDGLRFVAAFAVVLFHFTGRDSVAWGDSVHVVFPFLSSVTGYGGFGPYLFFMISGFVVLMSAWGRPLPEFVASRVGRLYPAYWVAVVVVAVVLYLNQDVIDSWSSLGVSGAAMNLTMVQSAFGVGNVDPVFWTLWIELKFYVLLGVMVLIGITRARVMALCFAWPVLGALAAESGNGLLVALLEPVFAPFFCIGLLLYLLHRDGWSAAAGLLLALNCCFALWVCASFIPGSLGSSGAVVSASGLAVLLTLSVAAIAAAVFTPAARLEWRWLTFLGALTYPLYLVHEVPGWVLIHHLGPLMPAYAAVFVAVCAVLATAYVVHRFVERPLGPRLRAVVARELTEAGRTDDASATTAAAGSPDSSRTRIAAGVHPAWTHTPLERQSLVRSSRT